MKSGESWVWSWVENPEVFFRDHVRNMTRQHIYRMLLDLYLRLKEIEEILKNE